MKLNDEYKVKIESFDMNGLGVCHLDNKVVFVENAMEGEEAIIEITSIHSKYIFSKAKKILKKSEHRILDLEKTNELSGEADLIHVDYETELKIKENKVKNTIKTKSNYKLNPIIKSDNPYNYRNKVMVPFGEIKEDDERDVIYGFYAKKSHNIIPIENDILTNEISSQILYLIQRYLELFNVSIYNETTQKGIFREVMIRNTINNDFMVVLVTTVNHDFQRLIEMLTLEFKEIKSIYLNINSKNTNVVLSDDFRLLYGTPTIKENILGLDFEVYPASFMQVNHNQCEKLYSEALRMADLKNDMNVIDAYCGIGSIRLNIAKNVNHVYGIEIVEDAITNANNNKKINNIENATFICGPCEKEIKKLANLNNIDIVFFDPPRKGCDIEFLNTIIEMKIPSIIYISCNVATLARDIKILEENGYELKEVTPADLFSKTSHVESISLLVRKDTK
jgi:23S rRNA (uracil1939-C5)-methyltransferase